MIVKEYDNAKIFLEEYEVILQEREAASQLLLYFVCQKLSSPEEEKGLYGAVIDEEAILLFSYIPTHNLVLYSIMQDKAIPAAIVLGDYLGNSHNIIDGIIAKQELCQSFIEQYKKHISCTFLQKQGIDIMEIRKVNEIKPVHGNHRLAQPQEAKLIADWMIQFQIEALLSELDYEAALKGATKLIEEGKIYLYENTDNVVVSMAVADRKLLHGIAITYIFTPEEYRGEGYAATNIYYLSKELLEQGYDFCTLFVDKKNPLSNRAYEKVGYKMLEDIYEYKVIGVDE